MVNGIASCLTRIAAQLILIVQYWLRLSSTIITAGSSIDMTLPTPG
jgi:hypothetical protein